MNELTTINDTTAMAVFESESMDGLDAIISGIETEARAEVPDISTPAGRKRVASIAAKVAKSKTALDKVGKELKSQWQVKVNAIDSRRRTARIRLDSLKQEIRDPLTQWEAAEKQRVADIRQRIAEIAPPALTPGNSAAIRVLIGKIETVVPADFEEFNGEAALAKDTALSLLKHALTVAEQKEEAERKAMAERAEKARQDEARRIEAERRTDELRAKQAQERAQAKKEAQEKARQERESRLVREAEENARRKAQAKADEIAAKAAYEKAEVERELMKERRQRQQEERSRQEAEKEKARLAADREHRAKIHRAILLELPRYGLNEEMGKMFIAAIARGDIANLSINYGGE